MTEFSVRLHHADDLVSFHVSPAGTSAAGSHGTRRPVLECSFQVRTAVVGWLLDYLAEPVGWRWSCSVNGWARTATAVLTVGELRWEWVAEHDGSRAMCVYGRLLNHQIPHATPDDAPMLVAPLCADDVTELREMVRNAVEEPV